MARGTKSPNTPHHRVKIPCEDVLDTPLAVDDDGDGANSLSARNFQSSASGWLCFRAKASQQSTQELNRAALLDGEWSQSNHQHPRQGAGAASAKTGAACAPASHAAMMCLGAWSSGMIRASGARGRGFDSRSSPSHTSHKLREQPGSRGTRAPTQAKPLLDKCGKALQ